jgi:hypothetical protein
MQLSPNNCEPLFHLFIDIMASPVKWPEGPRFYFGITFVEGLRVETSSIQGVGLRLRLSEPGRWKTVGERSIVPSIAGIWPEPGTLVRPRGGYS